MQQQQRQVYRTRVNGTRGVSRARLSPPKSDQQHGSVVGSFVNDGHSFSGGGVGRPSVDVYAEAAGFALPDLNAGARPRTSPAKAASTSSRPPTRDERRSRSPRRRREHGREHGPPPPPSISKSTPASSGLNNLVHATVGG